MSPGHLRRALAAGHTWWTRLFVVVLAVFVLVDVGLPWIARVAILGALAALTMVTAPRDDRAATVLDAPVRGRWMALNSPGTKVPSHGTTMYGQTRAVDLLEAEGFPERPVQPTYGGWGLRSRRPETFASFGLPVLAMGGGEVVAASDRWRDHGARTTWPQLIAMMTIEAIARELLGAGGLLGNHVLVRHDDGTVAVYAHLRRGSVAVRPGERVAAGDVLGEVGNTGNSSEPHLHVHLMDRAHPQAASGLAMTWRGLDYDATDEAQRVVLNWGEGPKPTAQPDFPPAGQVFRS